MKRFVPITDLSERKRRPLQDGAARLSITTPEMLIGYARVSTGDQTTAMQLDALRAAGCERIFEDTVSGRPGARPTLERAIGALAAGDTLVVWKLDRIGRSLKHLLEVAETLRERGIVFRSLTEHIDTGTAAGKLLYAVLGAAAQFERDVLRERTMAGLAATRRRGERLGRPPALNASQLRAARQMIDAGEPVTQVARIFEVGESTLYRAIAQ